MSTNVTRALLNQLLGNPLLLECDKTEVLGGVVLALVYRPDDLTDSAVLTKMLLDLVLANPGVGELAYIDLSWLNVSLLNCDTFPLKIIHKHVFRKTLSDNQYYLELVVFVGRRVVYGLHVLVEEESEAPGSPRHRIHLKFDAFEFTKGLEILFEVILTDILGKTSDKHFPVFLIVMIRHFSRRLRGF